MKRVVVLLLLCAVLQQSDQTAVSIRNPLQSPPSHLVVTDTGVLMAVQDKLVVFNVSTFSYLITYSGYDILQNTIAAIFAVDDNLLMVCLHSSRGPYSQCSLQVDYMHCSQFDARECVLQEFQLGALREDAGSITEVNNYFYSASSEEDRLVFTYFHLNTMPLTTIKNAMFGSRVFLHSFFHEGHIYFLALDDVSEMSREIRLMRACHSNNMTAIVGFESMFEMKLDCGVLPSNVTIVTYLKVNQTLILLLSDGRWSKICSFSLLSIDSKILQAYGECLGGEYTFQLPWLEQASSCSGFHQYAVSLCAFKVQNSLHGHHGVLEGVIEASHEEGVILLNITHLVLAATLVEVDEISYVYLALQNRISGTSIVKYLLSEDDLFLHQLLVYNTTSQVKVLSSDRFGHVYGASQHEILRLEVDNCSSYSTCSTCTNSGDPLCGWCVLEGKCSRDLSCSNHQLANRWTQNQQMCFEDYFMWEKNIVALDDLRQLKVSYGSTNGTFPELTERESYVCITTFFGHQLQFPLVQFGTDSYCMISDIPEYKHHRLEMQWTIEKNDTSYDSGTFVTFSASNNLTVYNCSRSQSCKECEVFPLCGWCPFKGKCTGRASVCARESFWINRKSMSSVTLCPAILPALEQSYYVHAAAAVNISLNARNIPPSVSYACELRYQNGRQVFTPAYSRKDTEIVCQVGSNQVYFSGDTSSSEEHLTFNVWTNSSEGMHLIEYLGHPTDGGVQHDGSSEDSSPSASAGSMVVYNCSVYSESCSLCTGTASMQDCRWCFFPDEGREFCSLLSECSTHTSRSVTINSSRSCFGSPQIRSVAPLSGPTAGGTRIVITGVDLGGAENEVGVKLGGFDCPVVQYTIAREIHCISPMVSNPVQLPINITVVRRSTDFNITFANANDDTFSYIEPSLRGVSPSYGPKSGGTRIVLRGTALNAGNMASTTVVMDQAMCDIQNITYSEITCITPPFAGRSNRSSTFILVHIDGATVVEEFQYTEDPHYETVQPQRIITAGGIAVMFSGQFLNSSSRPRLVVFVGTDSYYGDRCFSSNNSLLCISPRLPSFFEVANSHLTKRSRGDDSGFFLNYTVMQDDAPGPNISNPDLSIFLRDDPVFLPIDEDDREYRSSSGGFISIPGTNLDSVSPSEIRVTLVGEECVIIEVTPVLLNCRPPDFPLSRDRDIEVMVFVGNGSLAYSVGSVRFLRNDAEDQTVLSQWMPIIVGLLVIVVVVLLFVMGIICIVCVKRRNRVVAVEHQEIRMDPYLQTIKSISHEQSHEENVYEFIPEYPNGRNGHAPALPRNSIHLLNSSPEAGSGTNKPPLPTPVHSSPPQTMLVPAPPQAMAATPSPQSTVVVGQDKVTASPSREVVHSTQTSSDEYVSMTSHRVSSHLTPPDEMIGSECKEEVVLDGHITTRSSDFTSSAEYVDMRHSKETIGETAMAKKYSPLYPSVTLC